MFPFFLPFIHVLPGMQSEGIVCWSGPQPSSESKTREPPPHPAHHTQQDEVPRLGTGWVAMATRGCRAPKAIRNFNSATVEREPRVGRVTPGLEGSPAPRGGAGTVGWPFASGPPFPRL